MMSFFLLLFGGGLALVFVKLWWEDFRPTLALRLPAAQFVRHPKAREMFYFLGIIALPVLYVNFSTSGGSMANNGEFVFLISVLLSFIISFVWFRYLWSLDIYEREEYPALIIIFILACLCVFLVFILTGFLQVFGFDLNGQPWNDWWYCVIGIGLVEEICKIIPFLLILKFTNKINEPFDYILYGSLSALGFAFVENILYINDSNLEGVFGRALYASVAHMFDTSLITYAMAFARYRLKRGIVLPFFIGLIAAAVAHGFYDFWLINEAMKSFGMTLVFFLISIHLWVIMINNLINLSPFFDNSKKLRSRQYTYKIINWLITGFYSAYIAYFYIYGSVEANVFLLTGWSMNIYVFLFVALNIGSHEPIQGYIAQPSFKSQYIKMLLPRLFHQTDRSGAYLLLDRLSDRTSGTLNWHLPIIGKLERRVVFGNDTNCYLLRLERHIPGDRILTDYLLLQVRGNDHEIDSREAHIVSAFGLISLDSLDRGIIFSKDALLLGNYRAFGIDAPLAPLDEK